MLKMENINSVKYKTLVKRVFIFLIFYIAFFLYMRLITENNQPLIIFAHTLMLIIYILSLFRIKLGLFLFIFLIPLLNANIIPFVARPRYVLLFLFFGLFLGFIVNNTNKLLSSRLLQYPGRFIIDSKIGKAIIIFALLLALSSTITIFRYSNFFPFITNNYYDLEINVNGAKSTSSMIWTIRFFYNYFIGFLFFVLLFNVIEKVRDIINSIISLLLSTLIASGFIIYQYYFNPYLGNVAHWVNSGRFNATFSDPNSLGAYTILLFPIYIGLLIYFKRWYLRLFIAILFVFFFTLLILSGSRSAFIGIILALSIYILIFIIRGLKHIKSRWLLYRKWVKIIIVAIPVIIVMVVSLFPIYLFNSPDFPLMEISLINRTIESFKTGAYYASEYGFIEGFKSISNFRYIFWGQAVEMFKDYPLTGVGQGSYILQLPNYLAANRVGQISNGIFAVDFTGNYYLQVLSELGFPGIVLILFIYYLFINKIFNYFRHKRRLKKIEISDWILTALFISFISMLVGQIFGPHTNFDEIQLSFWLVTGLMIAYIRVNQVKFPDRFKPLKIQRVIRFSITEKLSLTFILLVFVSSFLISSFTSLSINSTQNLYDIIGKYRGWENKYGFYNEEIIDNKTIRWTNIDASESVEKKGSKMIMSFRDAIPVKTGKPVEVKIFVDNLLVEKAKLGHDKWTDLQIDIPGFTRDRFTLTIVLSRSWVPKKMGLSQDTRELGVQAGEYIFTD